MNIYQHFRPEERETIDQVLDWKQTVLDTYAAKLTDFLDPREQQIVKLIVGDHSEIRCQFFGGSEHAERKRALILPEFYSYTDDDFGISIFEIEYPRKFISIEHRQVLGSIMSLGLRREKFGDIFMEQDRIQLVVAREINSYIQMQLTSIGRAKIELKEVPLDQVLSIQSLWSEVSTTISSLRLDAVISALYNISRQKSQVLIEQGLVKVNFATTLKTAFECGEYDLISVRGYGRSKIISIEGRTKKDKIRIIAGKQK
jgi:RNA-binding protein YlmH